MANLVWVMHWRGTDGCITRVYSSREKAIEHLAKDCVIRRWDEKTLGSYSDLSNTDIVSNYFKQYEDAIIKTYDRYSNEDMEWTAPNGPMASVSPVRIDSDKEISELKPEGNA